MTKGNMERFGYVYIYEIYSKKFKKHFGKRTENLKRIRVIVDPREHKVR